MNNLPPINLQKKTFPFRYKLIIYFLIFFTLVLMSGVYISIGYRVSTHFFQKFLSQNYYLKQLTDNLQALEFFAGSYLSNRQQKSLENFKMAYTKIENLKKELKPTSGEFDKYDDLNIIINSLLSQAQKTVETKEMEERHYRLYLQLSANIQLGQRYIIRLINQNNRDANNKFAVGKSQLKRIEKKAITLALLSGLLSILFVIYFSINITRPLEKIMVNARKLSEGNFDVQPIKVKTNDELRSIAMVFNRMVADIKELFYQLKEKIQLERKLQQEKLENLRMNNLLRKAEIKKLQAQMNPHFLYNTLNTISQVAILEQADQTGKLIKKIARLFRYNLKEAETLVPITDELENVKVYCEIMEVRYGNKVNFKLDFPEDIENYHIPCMTIQPLIENAFIHGIAELENKQGIIRLSLKKLNNDLLIVVEDNGKGISEPEMKKIMDKDENSANALVNIRERLHLYFKEDNFFQIESTPCEGTKITLRVPGED